MCVCLCFFLVYCSHRSSARVVPDAEDRHHDALSPHALSPSQVTTQSPVRVSPANNGVSDVRLDLPVFGGGYGKVSPDRGGGLIAVSSARVPSPHEGGLAAFAELVFKSPRKSFQRNVTRQSTNRMAASGGGVAVGVAPVDGAGARLFARQGGATTPGKRPPQSSVQVVRVADAALVCCVLCSC